MFQINIKKIEKESIKYYDIFIFKQGDSMAKFYPLNGIPGYADGRLTLKVSRMWLIPSKLYLDNKPLNREKGAYLLGVKGQVTSLKFKRTGFDPVPKLSINGSEYRPALDIPLTLPEQFWCVLPFLALISSYSIGAFFLSAFFSLCNLWIFHNRKRGMLYKYSLSFINMFLNCFFILLIHHILQK